MKYEKIENLKSDVFTAQQLYLEENGWKKDKHVPKVSFNVWEKDWRGRQLTGDTDTAVEMERAIGCEIEHNLVNETCEVCGCHADSEASKLACSPIPY